VVTAGNDGAAAVVDKGGPGSVVGNDGAALDELGEAGGPGSVVWNDGAALDELGEAGGPGSVVWDDGAVLDELGEAVVVAAADPDVE
jgi:hypothetical protein